MEEINEILSGLKIRASCVNTKTHRHYKFYDLRLEPSCRVRSLENLAEEIALGLRCKSKPIIEPIPELGIVRIKTVTGDQSLIKLKHLPKPPTSTISMVLGETEFGEPLICSLDDNPHLLVAGTTGSGKSSLLHTMIHNLVGYEDDVSIFLGDPKFGSEFGPYNGFKNIKWVAVNYKQIVAMLNRIHDYMEENYKFSKGFIRKKVVVIIDEVADLMLIDKSNNKDFEKLLVSIAQKSRAVGIHLIIATQRPSVDIINGVIKANFPARIACKVASAVDSKVILDKEGAESLVGKGDSIIINSKYNYVRFQSAFTTVKDIV